MTPSQRAFIADFFSRTSTTARVQPLAIIISWCQGVYYLITGIWPIVSIDTFQQVTGPKTDLWLVKTVGLLIVVIAVTILTAAWRKRISAEVVVLAVGSAMALTAVDIIYTNHEVIPPIYLLDAAIEVVVLIGWGLVLVFWQRERSEATSHQD